VATRGDSDAVVQLGLRSLAAIRAGQKLVIYYDSELTGFGLRVMPSGHRSWIVEYRSKAPETFGAKRRMVIGAPDKLTPDEARKQARKLLAQIELGRDPAAERAKARKGESVSAMLQLYMDEKIRPTRKRRTAEVFASYIRKHIEPAIGRRQSVGLSRGDVLKLHHAIGKTHPVTANRVVTLIAAAFSHAKKAGIVPENFRNPARQIDKFREQARERYLSTAELQRLGDTLRLAETEGLPWIAGRSKYSPAETCELDPFAIAAIRLLLLTGCRSGEILNLRWSEVDLDRGLLHLPDSKTGKKTIVLAAPAMEVLASLPRAGEFVIPGGAQGHRGDLRGPLGSNQFPRGPSRGAPARSAPFIRQRGRWRRAWPAHHWSSFGTRAAQHDRSL
jgi:integrase